MAEVRIGVVADVYFHLIPVALRVSDFLAFHTDRQQPLKIFDFVLLHTFEGFFGFDSFGDINAAADESGKIVLGP